jgi:hypothetical protein
MDTSAYLKGCCRTDEHVRRLCGRPGCVCPGADLSAAEADRSCRPFSGTQRVVATLVGERMTEPSRASASYVPGPTDSAQWRLADRRRGRDEAGVRIGRR